MTRIFFILTISKLDFLFVLGGYYYPDWWFDYTNISRKKNFTGIHWKYTIWRNKIDFASAVHVRVFKNFEIVIKKNCPLKIKKLVIFRFDEIPCHRSIDRTIYLFYVFKIYCRKEHRHTFWLPRIPLNFFVDVSLA